MNVLRNMRAVRRTGLLACLALAAVIGPDARACATNEGSADGPAAWTFDIAIEHGQVAEDVRTVRVSEGDTVHLHWTSDAPLVLHLHGYDIEMTVEPGRMTAITFEAEVTGRFAVEVHEQTGSHVAAHGNVPIVYVEVYPR